MGFMENLLTFRVRGKDAKETTPPRVALLQRPGSLHGWEPESNGAGPVSAMQMHIVSASLALLRVQQMTTPAKRDGRIEFANQSRPDGWNAWVTFVISPAEQTPSSTPRRMITK